MGRSARIVVLAGLLAVFLIDTASAAEQRFFSITVSGSGQFTQDYGEDRYTEGSRGFGTDGKTTVSWRWKIKSVGRADGERVPFAAAEFRRSVTVQSSTLEYDHNTSGGRLQEDPHCEDSYFKIATGASLGAIDDATGNGAWVKLPFARNMSLDSSGFNSAMPSVQDSCAFHANPEGLDFYESALVEIPRGAFNPKFDASYSESFQDSVNESRIDHDYCCAPLAHSLQGSSKLQIKAKKISKRSAERRRKSYRKEDPYEEGIFLYDT